MLSQAWHSLIAPYTHDSDADDVGQALLANWAEPRRCFHNTDHLRDVLLHVDELASHAADPDAVRLAAWYHDAVCDGRPDDAMNSAARAEIELWSLGLPAALVAEVKRLVRLTATHDPGGDDPNGEALCDADLAVLAAPPPGYHHYIASLRDELAHLRPDVFCAARLQILRSLLDRAAVFHTPRGQHDWEPTARANLAAELHLLSRDLTPLGVTPAETWRQFLADRLW
jgi:predicted metal-dependent HD superfamily phosphohydrolase